MTIIPQGARLAPVDLPPPPPASDPREPESHRSRTLTPQRARSPLNSRASSPTRGDSTSPPPLLAPKPRTASGSLPSGKTQTLSAHHAHAHAPTHAHHATVHHAHPHLSRPSSPASIHSSGSAIFERDIELPSVASALSLNPSSSTLSHKSSRVFHPHGSQLEHSVPAVLDDAVEALTADDNCGIDELEIEAPASNCVGRSGSASMSPALRSRVVSLPRAHHSRSPSPDSAASSAPPLSLAALSQSPSKQVSPIATSLPPSALDGQQISPSSPGKHRPAPLRQLSSGPLLPGGWAFTDEDATGATAIRTDESGTQTPVPSALPAHLTPSKDKRRISYISYNDLLLSVPTTVTSLNEITSGNLSPDHLPGTVSPSVQSRSPVMAASPVSAGLVPELMPLGAGGSHGSHGPRHGEWQREGLGRGLEQRLEDLVMYDAKPVQAQAHA